MDPASESIPPQSAGGLRHTDTSPAAPIRPRRGDHPSDEDEQVDGDANANERRRKAAERVAHDHDSATATDGLHDTVGVLLPASRLVLDREIDGDSVVPALVQRRPTRCQSHALPPPPWMSANVATAATLPEAVVSGPRSCGAGAGQRGSHPARHLFLQDTDEFRRAGRSEPRPTRKETRCAR